MDDMRNDFLDAPGSAMSDGTNIVSSAADDMEDAMTADIQIYCDNMAVVKPE